VSKDKSKAIVGIFLLMTVLFLVFIVFAFYTVSSLKGSANLEKDFSIESETAPIAIVEIEGVIMESEKAVKKLMIAENDKNVKAILLRINSPGGAVGPTQEIYEEVRRIDAIKPVYASFGSVAASGGYYIGAATRKIFANAGALTGSIGVIMQFMDLSKLYEFAKVAPETIKAGKYKDVGSPARQMTAEERMLLNGMITKVHEQFIQDIHKVRGEKIIGGMEGLREAAQGQIFSGEGAHERGLVDEIAGMWQAVRSIQDELKIKDDKSVKFIKIKKKMSFMEFIEGMEESLQDITHKIKGSSNMAPLFLYHPGK
jgi:protease-4